MGNLKNKIKAVIHGKNLTEEERAKFNRPLSFEEIVKALNEGSGGPILMSRRDNPDDNVSVEYVKKK